MRVVAMVLVCAVGVAVSGCGDGGGTSGPSDGGPAIDGSSGDRPATADGTAPSTRPPEPAFCDPAARDCLRSTCEQHAGVWLCLTPGGPGGECLRGPDVAPCQTGLVCAGGTFCAYQVQVGEACRPQWLDLCVSGASCVGAPGLERCVSNGTAGGRCSSGSGGVLCGAGLVCSGGFAGVCGAPIAAGRPCGRISVAEVCDTGLSCQGAPGRQRCVPDGMLGGRCGTAAGDPTCDAGQTCEGQVCVQRVPMGMGCSPDERALICAARSSCAPMGLVGTCLADGTAEGTACRSDGGCGGDLACDGAGADGVCRSAGTLGGACNPQFNSVACPSGSACVVATASAAACAATRPEAEPNNAPLMAQAPIAASAAFSGSVGAPGDPADCFGVTVPANGAVVVETSVADHPGCVTARTRATLFNAAGVAVETSSGGPRHASCAYFAARALAAGRYALCVSAGDRGGVVEGYAVAIGVFAP